MTATTTRTRNPLTPAAALDLTLICQLISDAGISATYGEAGGGCVRADIGTPGTSVAWLDGDNEGLYPLIMGPGRFLADRDAITYPGDLSIGHDDEYGDTAPLWRATPGQTEREIADVVIELHDQVTSRWKVPTHNNARGNWCRASGMRMSHPARWATDGNTRCLHDCPGSEVVRLIPATSGSR